MDIWLLARSHRSRYCHSRASPWTHSVSRSLDVPWNFLHVISWVCLLSVSLASPWSDRLQALRKSVNRHTLCTINHLAASGILLLSPLGFCRLCLVLATQPCPVASSVLAGRLRLSEAGCRTTQGLLINCLLHVGVQAGTPTVVQLHLNDRISAANTP